MINDKLKPHGFNVKKSNSMKNKVIFCIAVMGLFVLSLSAQDLRLHVNQKGQIGFVDASGNEVIKCEYESAQPFVDGLAIVTRSGKSGLIDKTGQVVVPLKYTQISTWGNGLYLLNAGKQVGLADHNGTILLKASYSQISKPNCYGKAVLALGGKATKSGQKTYMLNAKYGIIDANGKILVQPTYKGLFEFSAEASQIAAWHEGKALQHSFHFVGDTLTTDCKYLGVSANGFSCQNCGIINGEGTVLLQPKKYSFVMLPKSDMVRYYNITKKSTTCGYHNLTNGEHFEVATYDQPFTNIQSWTHGDFSGDIAPVNGNTWSFIDKSGNTLRTGYSVIIHSEATNLWAGKAEQGTCEVFDENNQSIASLSGFEAMRFPMTKEDKELFCVKRNGLFGVIDRDGNTMIPFEYSDMSANIYDVIAAKKDGKWGILDTEGKELVPLLYTDVTLPEMRNTKHFWVKKEDGLFYHYDTQNKTLANTGFKNVKNFIDGFALVVPVDLTLQDNSVTRAQCYAPNTKPETLAKVDLSTMTNSFGYIVDTNNKIVMSLPVSTLYEAPVREYLIKAKGANLSEGVQRRILLHVTRQNRTYKIQDVLDENEWDY